MADENKTERVQLLMTPSEVKAIDDWSFENRIRGRAEAMRRLCQIGLGLSAEQEHLAVWSRENLDASNRMLRFFVQALKTFGKEDIDRSIDASITAFEKAIKLDARIQGNAAASNLIVSSISDEEVRSFKDTLHETFQTLREERQRSEKKVAETE